MLEGLYELVICRFELLVGLSVYMGILERLDLDCGVGFARVNR